MTRREKHRRRRKRFHEGQISRTLLPTRCICDDCRHTFNKAGADRHGHAWTPGHEFDCGNGLEWFEPRASCADCIESCSQYCEKIMRDEIAREEVEGLVLAGEPF